VLGDQSIRDGSDYRIPKRDVISSTQVLFQTGRLKIAGSCRGAMGIAARVGAHSPAPPLLHGRKLAYGKLLISQRLGLGSSPAAILCPGPGSP
jgi:hypothetical protein